MRLAIATLAVAAVAAVLVRVLLGDYVVALTDLLPILRGETLPDAPGASFIVMEAKLPRALVGLLAGAAFGAAGAMFQTTLCNPLASPDIIGISIGASAAAVIALTFLDAQGIWLPAAALVGAVAVRPAHVRRRSGDRAPASAWCSSASVSPPSCRASSSSS